MPIIPRIEPCPRIQQHLRLNHEFFRRAEALRPRARAASDGVQNSRRAFAHVAALQQKA